MNTTIQPTDNHLSNKSSSPIVVPTDYDEAEWGVIGFDSIAPGPMALAADEEAQVENQTYFYLTDHYLHRSNFAVFVASPLVLFMIFCFYGAIPSVNILTWSITVLLSDALILLNTRNYDPKNTTVDQTNKIRRKLMVCHCLNAAAWGSALIQLAKYNHSIPNANYILFTSCAVIIAFASNVMATSLRSLCIFIGVIGLFMLSYFGWHFSEYAIWFYGTFLLLISTIFIGKSNNNQIKEYLKVTVLNEFLTEKLTKNNATLHSLATVDALTGANNRRWIADQLTIQIAEAKRYQQPLSVLLIDVDHFKRVNDTHGHEVGDFVLINVVNLLQNWMRDSDLMGRFGGEEFLVLLPMTTVEQASVLAERLRLNIAQNSTYKKEYNHELTVSIGLAGFDAKQANSAQKSPEKIMKQLVNNADQALYKAKGNGRNRVELYADN